MSLNVNRHREMQASKSASIIAIIQTIGTGNIVYMKEQPKNTDEAYAVLTENRHLKNTIAVLRDQLEALRNGRDEAVQKAVALANDEIAQLRSAVSVLREELECKAAEYLDALQEERRLHRDELNQLQRMIQELRDALTKGSGEDEKSD